MTIEQQNKIRDIINKSNKIVFFGGAGVSTESGIPDFRSKDGLYNSKDVRFERFTPETLLSHGCLFNHPKVFYEFYRQKLDVRNVEPNITHKVLAKMEQKGKLLGIITQNIDGLHQKAGSVHVAEIHGTTQKNYCNKCKMQYPSDFIFNSTEDIPKCECGGLIRPYVTLYDEQLPKEEVKKADEMILNADCLIVAGTSLNVYPAANYVSDFSGEHIIVINKQHLNLLLSEENDIQINEPMGKVFEYIEGLI